MWGQVEKTTTTAELPGVFVASPGVPTFSLNVTGGAQWKAYFDFQRNAASKGQVGIDYAADGTNRLYFYGGTVAYVSKWPAAQGAASSCLQNDGAGDLTWVACGGSSLWTDGGVFLYNTTTADKVVIGSNAQTENMTNSMLQIQSSNSYSGITIEGAANVTVPAIYFTRSGHGSSGVKAAILWYNHHANKTFGSFGMDMPDSGTIEWFWYDDYYSKVMMELESDTLKIGGNSLGQIWLRETIGSGSNHVGFKSPTALAGDVVWTLPIADSAGAQCLQSNGAAVLSWTTCGGGWTSAGGVIYTTTTTDHVQVGGGATTSELRLMEQSGGGANYTGFVAPALAADVVYTMPTADGGAGTCLSTSGAKVLSWAACTGAAAGWQDDGAVVRLVTTTDTVAIGRADLHSTGGTFLVEKSATTAIGGDIWISNSGVNAVGSAARLAFMPDNSADSTPNASMKAIMIDADQADLVWEMYDGTGFEQKMRLVNWDSTFNALIIGDGARTSLCCGESLSLLGTRDSHSNTAFTIYRSGTTTLGGAISVIGTTAGDWVNSSVQNDFVIRGQSTVYLSSGTSGHRGYRLTETTHDWYVSDASKMDLSATRFYSSIPIYLANGTAAAPSLSFNSDVNTGMYWISADFLGLATGGSLRAGFSVSTNNGVMNLYGNGAGGTAWATGGIISSYDSSNANKNLQFAVPQVGGSTGNNGTAALPFYSFYDDEDIGMYRKSSNVLAFALSSSGYFSMSQGAFRHSYVMHTAANGAADTWSVSAIIRSEDATPDRENIAFDAGQIGPYTGNLGTAALPFYSFEDDPNTGIYSSGGDTISFSTGGTLRAEITGYAFKISGNQVVGARGAAVADAAGGATVDTEARAAINALLARLRTHGLIAP